jgi:hypothetical protein
MPVVGIVASSALSPVSLRKLCCSFLMAESRGEALETVACAGLDSET